MTMVIPVAFAGLARSGKTTATEHIQTHMDNINGVHTIRMSFAGPIRDGLEVMGVTKNDNPVLYRHLAQLCGDDSRNSDKGGMPLWWIDLMRKNITSIAPNPAIDVIYVLIDDVRYPNELDLVSDLSGVTYFVDAGNRMNVAQDMYNHNSEKMAMDVSRNLNFGNKEPLNFKGVLDNNGSISYYIDQLDRVCSMLEPQNYLVEIGAWK